MSEDATAPADAFAALGDGTRVAILRALADHRREADGDPRLSFSALRERVGMRDSGQFNYHLEKLRGRFVERTDDGYGLTYADFELLTAGICPECYGAVEGSIGPLDADGESDLEWAYRTTCRRCGVTTTSMAGLALLHDAAFLGFCADRGVALHERLPWALPLDAPVERTSEAPPRFRVPVVMDDERFVATLSGTGEVLQTGREPIS